MDISVTHAKQEVDVIKRIFAQSSYAESLNEVSIFLHQFEGKHFRHLTTNLLHSRIIEILNKFKRKAVINNYFKDADTSVTSDLLLRVDVENKESSLESYKNNLENFIYKNEMDRREMRASRTQLNTNNNSFRYMLPNGDPIRISLKSRRSHSNHMYLLFKALYDYWLDYGGQVITKDKIKYELEKSGWDGVTDIDIKNYIGNLRSKILEPEKLDGYIKIESDRK